MSDSERQETQVQNGSASALHPKPRRRWRIRISDILAGSALIISVGSAAISHQQLASVRQQLQLSELQIRPYVRYRPIFTQEAPDRLDVMLLSENLSPIPAHVIYDELKTWIDETTTSAFLFNRTGDVLYQHKNGFAHLPPMPKEIARAAINGKKQVMIGTCVVYKSISASDKRKWEVRGLYSYAPGSELPSVEYLQEVNVQETVNRCESGTIRSEWLQKRAEPAKKVGPD